MRSTRLEHQSEGHADCSTVADHPPAAGIPAGTRMVPVPGLARGPEADQVRRRGDDPTDPLGGSQVSPETQGALSRLQGRGRPLPATIAHSMGEAMGADLGEVRIHTGSEPAELARSVQATAFTLGRDIYFGSGSYDPQTPSGQRLLAHELAHTVQQGTPGGPGGGPVIGRAADPAEHEADRVADGVLRVLQRRAREPSEPERPENGAEGRTASPAVLRTLSSGPTRLRRKVGFEAELMVPSLGPSANKLKYLKSPGDVTDSIKSFLDGGVPYGTDMGGKAEGVDVRLDSDHGGAIDRAPIVQKLTELGFVSGEPHEPETKIEFVTAAVDELAPGANKRLRTVGESLKQLLADALAQAQSGKMSQLGPPAKAGYKTGVPVEDLDSWWWLDRASLELDAMIQHYLKNGIKDDVYLQATVGVFPSALLKFFAHVALPGGKVEVAPPSQSRKQILGIVQEVVADLDTTFKRAPDEHWVTKLDPDSRDAFLGLLGLVYSYLLGDTLQQTSGGTKTTVKNAVPFLIKMSPYGLLAKTATQVLKNDPPPQEFVRKIGDLFKATKYLQLAYWVEAARGEEPTAVGDGKLAAKLNARPGSDRLITGDYTDFTERVLLGSGGAMSIVVGKELPAADKPTTNSGDVNVFYELYNQSGIPLEYRAITKRYKVSEVLPAISEIVADVRLASMGGLTDEQKAKVKEAYESDV